MEDTPTPQFRSRDVHGEFATLGQRAMELEAHLAASGLPKHKARHAALQKCVNEHWCGASGGGTDTEPDGVRLSDEEHARHMQHLEGILSEYGTGAAIKAARKSNNHHVIDDFHRLLTEYVYKYLKGSEARGKDRWYNF